MDQSTVCFGFTFIPAVISLNVGGYDWQLNQNIKMWLTTNQLGSCWGLCRSWQPSAPRRRWLGRLSSAVRPGATTVLDQVLVLLAGAWKQHQLLKAAQQKDPGPGSRWSSDSSHSPLLGNLHPVLFLPFTLSLMFLDTAEFSSLVSDPAAGCPASSLLVEPDWDHLQAQEPSRSQSPSAVNQNNRQMCGTI